MKRAPCETKLKKGPFRVDTSNIAESIKKVNSVCGKVFC